MNLSHLGKGIENLKCQKKETTGNCDDSLIDSVLQLQDSSDLYKNKQYSKMRGILEKEGFLLVRGIIPEEVVQRGREELLKQAEKNKTHQGKGKGKGKGKRKKKNNKKGCTVHAQSGGISPNGNNRKSVMEWSKIGNSITMTEIYNGHYLHDFYSNIFGQNKFTPFPNQTWFRLKSKGEFTVEHVDYYYFRSFTTMFSEKLQVSNINQVPHTCQICQ